MSKNVLIVEKSSEPIKFQKVNDEYILEGIFTEIGVRNRNNRIYEEREFVPHIDLLQSKIKTKELVGELDHPQGYEISFQNVSHVIEKLEYNNSTKQVRGKIKILPTQMGQTVKGLLDSGIPIYISSRAAGIVESNGIVKLKELFTYDIVANAGFANAKLNRVYESLGLNSKIKLKSLNESLGMDGDDNIQIYEITEKEKTNNMKTNKSDFVTISMIDEYSKEVVNEMKKLDAKIGVGSNVSELENKVNQLIKHNNYLAEQLEKSIKYSEYVAEKTGQIIDYTENEIVEKLKKSIEYSEYLAEQLQKRGDYTDYLAEKLNDSIEHNDHIVESFNKFENDFKKYSDYLAESVNKRNTYMDYIAENLDKSIQHGDYIAEQLDKSIDYSEYIKENVETGQKYMNYLSESLNEKLGLTQPKNKINESQRINENKKLDRIEKSNELDLDSLDMRLKKILESVKEDRIEKTTKYKFTEYLLESQKERFKGLDERTRQGIVREFETKQISSPRQAQVLFESFFVEKEIPLYESKMPSKYKEVWNSLTESQKDVIRGQASVRTLQLPHQIEHFWMTRDLRMFERQNAGLSNRNGLIKESNENKRSNGYVSNVEMELRRRFGK